MDNREFLMAISFSPKVLNGEEVRMCLEGADAFWVYDGKPSAHRSHALLTSGKHSNGYVNVGAALKEFVGFRRAIAHTLITELLKVWDGRFTHVVGADTSSTDLAGDIAKIAKANHIRMVKYEDGEGRKQVWRPDNKPLRGDDLILHVEELITTSFSAFHVREGIRRHNPEPIHFVPFLPTVVDRSDPGNRVTKVEDSKILPLLQLNIRNFDPGPENCPYCTVGSQTIKPKEGNNWSILTGK